MINTNFNSTYRYQNYSLPAKQQGNEDSLFSKPIHNSIKLNETPKTEEKHFSPMKAAKNFVEGFFDVGKALIEHPVKSVAIMAGLGIATAFVPQIAGVCIALGVVSAVTSLAKGVYNAAKAANNKEWDKAEESFKDIGSGTSGIVLSAFFAKGMANVRNMGAAAASEEEAGVITGAVKTIKSEIVSSKDGFLTTLGANVKAIKNIITNKQPLTMDSFLETRHDIFSTAAKNLNLSEKAYENYNLSNTSFSYIKKFNNFINYSWTYLPNGEKAANTAENFNNRLRK